jgi:hypothetical protein
VQITNGRTTFNTCHTTPKSAVTQLGNTPALTVCVLELAKSALTQNPGAHRFCIDCRPNFQQ